MAPSTALILGGAGSTDIDGKTKLTANSVSAVIRVIYNGEGIFLLPGDLDNVGMSSMIAEGKDAKSKVLLYPHHGGLPGKTSPEEFTRQLFQHVQPELVIFSNSREQFSNPRAEIVAALKVVSSATIACTQLSKSCLANNDGLNAAHLHDIPANGKRNNSCCAGSIRFNLDDLATKSFACLDQHKVFVSTCATSPLCKI